MATETRVEAWFPASIIAGIACLPAKALGLVLRAPRLRLELSAAAQRA